MSDMGCFLLPLLMLPLVTEHTWWSAVEESEESEETDDDAFDFASWLEGFQPVQTSRAISYLDENVQPYHRAKIHFYFITRISSTFCCLVAFISNLYIILAIRFGKDLYDIQYYPIFLLALGDLVSSGFGGALYLFLLNQDQSIPGRRWLSRLGVKTDFSSDFWANCLKYILMSRLNEYVTGPVTLAIAVERYIMVCVPYDSKTLLSRKRRRIAYVLLSLAVFPCLLAELLYRYLTQDAFLCHMGIYLTHGSDWRLVFLSSLANCVFFFVIPAIGSCVLYVKVMKALKVQQTEVARNKVLTVAFIVSTSIWVILWTLKYLYQYVWYWSIHSDYSFAIQEFFGQSTAMILLRGDQTEFITFLSLLSSGVNPVVLFVVVRPFRAPLVSIFGSLKPMIPRF